MEEKTQIEESTSATETKNVLPAEVEIKEQKDKVRAEVIKAMERTFTDDVINDYLRKYPSSERKGRQESLATDLGELATALKNMVAVGDLNLQNDKVTEAVICDFLGSKRLSRLTKIIKGEEIGLVDEEFLQKATKEGLNVSLSGEHYGIAQEEEVEKKTTTNEITIGDNKTIVSEKDFFEKTKINPDKIYVNRAGKKMKVVGYRNGKVQVAFLPSGIKVEEGVNVINLDSEWESDIDDEEMGVPEFLTMIAEYDEMSDSAPSVSNEKAKEAEKVDSMEVVDAKKEKGETLSLKDLTELFGVAGSVHVTEDGINKLEILNYLYKKDETKWEIEVKESETAEKKILSPDDLQDLIATKYTKIDFIPEVEAGGMKSAEFVAEFGKSGEFVFKSDVGGLKSFVIEKDKFSKQSNQHMAKILSAGEESGRYVSIKELRQMISNGMYRKELNPNNVSETAEEETETEPKEWRKTGTHFEEWMKKTENFKEDVQKSQAEEAEEIGAKNTETQEPGKKIEGLEGVDLAILKDEFLQLNEIMDSLLSDKDISDQKNNQLQEVEASLNKYKEELERRGENIDVSKMEQGNAVEKKPLNFDEIVGDDEAEKNPENPENKKEEEPKIKTKKEKFQEEQAKMNEKFEAWKKTQVDFEKKGNELNIVKRNLAKLGISFGEDAEVMKELHSAKKAMEKAEKDFKNAHIEFVAPLSKNRRDALKHAKIKDAERNEMMQKYLFAEKLIEKESVDEKGEKKMEKISLMEDLGNKMLELNKARKEALAERENGTVEKLFARYQKIPKKKKLLIATALAGVLGAGGALFAGAAVGTALGAGALSGGTRLARSLFGGAAGAFAFRAVRGRGESTRKERSKNIEGATINKHLWGGRLDMVSMIQKKATLERNDNIKAMAAAGITGFVLGGGIRALADWPDVPNPTIETPAGTEAKSIENPDPVNYEETNDNPATKGFSETEAFKEFQKKFSPAEHDKFIEAHGGKNSENELAWLNLVEAEKDNYLEKARLEAESKGFEEGYLAENLNEQNSQNLSAENLDVVPDDYAKESAELSTNDDSVIDQTVNPNETAPLNDKQAAESVEDSQILTDKELSGKLKDLNIDENHDAWKAIKGMKLNELNFIPRSGAAAAEAFRNNTIWLPPEVLSKLGTLDIREAKRIGQIAGAVFNEIDQSAIGAGDVKLEDALKGDYSSKSIGAGVSSGPEQPNGNFNFPPADEDYLKNVINEEPPSSKTEGAVLDAGDREFIKEGESTTEIFEVDHQVFEDTKGSDFSTKLTSVTNYIEENATLNNNLEEGLYGDHKKALLTMEQIRSKVGLGDQSLQESIDKYLAAGNKLETKELSEIEKLVKYLNNFDTSQ